MSETKVSEVSLTEAKSLLSGWWEYLVSKWIWIALSSIIFGVLGVLYAHNKKPLYTAEITFAAESGRGSMGGYAALASQFGLDLGGGSAFEGDNLIYLLKSRRLIDNTFLTRLEIEGKPQLIIEYFIKTRLEKNAQNPYSKISFSADQKTGNRVRDSIMKSFHAEVRSTLNIFRVDRRIDIIYVSITDKDELFAKIFTETLVNNAIRYYEDYKTKKSKRNVAILQKQSDSIRRLISGGITSIAATNDLNINPMRQITQTGVQRKGIDVQVNSALYGDLAKSLQASNMVMRQETPFIQIVDYPILPLDKKKLGKAKGGLIFAFIGNFLAALFFVIKRMIQRNRQLIR